MRSGLELDLERKFWTVPAVRMKAGREQRVPLSPRAMSILDSLINPKLGEYVFPSEKADKPMSSMAMEMMLRRMKVTDASVHGFRDSRSPVASFGRLSENSRGVLADVALCEQYRDCLKR